MRAASNGVSMCVCVCVYVSGGHGTAAWASWPLCSSERSGGSGWSLWFVSGRWLACRMGGEGTEEQGLARDRWLSVGGEGWMGWVDVVLLEGVCEEASRDHASSRLVCTHTELHTALSLSL